MVRMLSNQIYWTKARGRSMLIVTHLLLWAKRVVFKIFQKASWRMRKKIRALKSKYWQHQGGLQSSTGRLTSFLATISCMLGCMLLATLPRALKPLP